MKLKYAIAAACMVAAAQGLNQAQKDAKAAFDAKRAAAKAKLVMQKAMVDADRLARRAKKAGEVQARQDEVTAKEAERQAKHEEWWARVSKIMEKKKQKDHYFELKEIQRQQKENFALQKQLDLATKREAHQKRLLQQADRVLLKELRKVQKQAWKALNKLQKDNYEALDADQKAAWDTNRAEEIETFNTNLEDWETEDQRQKAQWEHIMAHQQVHWAAKVSGLYEGGSQCSMPGNDFNPLYETEDLDHSLDISSYDEADLHVGAVSFARNEGTGGFYVLISTDRANALYEIHTNVFADQAGVNSQSGYSEHSKARNFQKASGVDALANDDGAYSLKLVGISDVDGSQYNWAICYNQ